MVPEKRCSVAWARRQTNKVALLSIVLLPRLDDEVSLARDRKHLDRAQSGNDGRPYLWHRGG